MKGYAKFDHSWLAQFIPTLPAREGIILFLQSKATLRQQKYGLGHLVEALQKDPRTVQRALDLLLKEERVFEVDGFLTLTKPVTKASAKPPTKMPTSLPTNSSIFGFEKAVLQSKSLFPKNKKNMENKKNRVVEEIQVIDAASAPQNSELQNPALPSQEKQQHQGQESGIQDPSAPTPSFGRPPSPGPVAPTLSPAAQFFQALNGQYLLRKHAADLDRWYATYTEDQLRAIWDAALHVREAKPRMFNLVDMLEGTLAMPKALHDQLKPVQPEGTQPTGNLKLFDPKARMLEELIEAKWDPEEARKAVYG